MNHNLVDCNHQFPIDIMPTVTFIEHNGTVHQVDAPLDRSLMQIALAHRVPGILAECGGSCSCGTCHAHVDPAWLSLLPPASETEAFMLEIVPEVRDESRLCCQLTMRPELDGLVLRLPSEQL